MIYRYPQDIAVIRPNHTSTHLLTYLMFIMVTLPFFPATFILAADNPNVTQLRVDLRYRHLSSALDNFDYVLLHQVQSVFWSQSCRYRIDWLTCKSPQILRDGCLFDTMLPSLTLPRGSLLDPILFILYTVELFDISASYSRECRSYVHF